jgi:hypothetical protein
MPANTPQPLHNWTAQKAPTLSDDATKGYQPGSFWMFVGIKPALYVCLEASAGKALWKQIA